MAVPRKLIVVPNEATRELWRIVEDGELDELEAVLPRADVNARNEHGMTPLMRAARYGRVPMVRALLEQGADPNVTRNDNFTALSLAAFFGHAEIVEILMQHGAKTDVATRFGTSPQIWARARSYGDVVRSLEKRHEDLRESVTHMNPKPSRSSPAQTQSEAPIVIRTLKEPPEIWDLVHEAPRNFNARSAFMARMGSRKGGVVIATALILVVGAGTAAAIIFKDRLRWPSANAPAPKAPAPAIVAAPVVSATTNATTPTVASEAPVVATEPVSTELSTNPGNRRLRPKSRAASTPVNNERANVETAVAPPAVVPRKPDTRTPPVADTKKNAAPLSSQLVSPTKPSQPKAKVIQWP